MSIINIDQKLRRVEVSSFEMDNQIVFNYFDSVSESERDEKLFRAIYIGILALMEDRFSAFLSKTQNELGTELESLKLIFEMKKEMFFKSTIKGVLAEEEIADYLLSFTKEKKLNDRILLTGNSAGVLTKNKTGDIVCELDGSQEKKITIECKFDKSIKLGDIESKEILTKKTETAWSQLIESNANRNSNYSIIVFDVSLVDASIYKKYETVGYIPAVGFVCIIDSQKGDYRNLSIAYTLARDFSLTTQAAEIDFSVLEILIRRFIKDATELISLKTLIKTNISTNLEILKRLEKNVLMMEFNQKYLTRFIKEGTLTKKELLDFYLGEDIKDQYKIISKEIESEFGFENTL